MIENGRIRRALMMDQDELTEMNILLARETEGRELPGDRVKAGVKAVIKDPRKGFYLVMESSQRPGALLGQLMVTFEWSDWNNSWYWWLQSVYVRIGARRQGVFTKLFQSVFETARYRKDVHGIRLYLEKHNRAARETYLSLGLRRSPYDLLEHDF